METDQSKVLLNLRLLITFVLQSLSIRSALSLFLFHFLSLILHSADSENAETIYQCKGLEFLVKLYLTSPPAEVVVCFSLSLLILRLLIGASSSLVWCLICAFSQSYYCTGCVASDEYLGAAHLRLPCFVLQFVCEMEF
jgi:hypothetical protein